MNETKVVFIGPLPPPVHGFSEINQRMLMQLQNYTSVKVFDLSPGGKKNKFSNIINILNLFMLLIRFFIFCLKNRNVSVYLPLSGGVRQLVDTCFVLIALLFRLRIYVHHHSFAYLNAQPFYARIVLRLLKNSNHIVLCQCMADFLNLNYAIPESKTRILSNSVFLDTKSHVIKKPTKNKKLVLGFLSNITEAKGCFRFISLLEAAIDEGLAVEGIMAGPVHPDIQVSFHNAIANSTAVKHIGPVYGNDKLNFFSEIDVLVFPTTYANEAEPVTIWEAISASVPVISLSRGCISEIVANEFGWLINDPESFVNEGLVIIRTLLANNVVLKDMSCNARIAFERSNKVFTANLDIILHEILINLHDTKSFKF